MAAAFSDRPKEVGPNRLLSKTGAGAGVSLRFVVPNFAEVSISVLRSWYNWLLLSELVSKGALGSHSSFSPSEPLTATGE